MCSIIHLTVIAGCRRVASFGQGGLSLVHLARLGAAGGRQILVLTKNVCRPGVKRLAIFVDSGVENGRG